MHSSAWLISQRAAEEEVEGAAHTWSRGPDRSRDSANDDLSLFAFMQHGRLDKRRDTSARLLAASSCSQPGIKQGTSISASDNAADST